MEAIHCCVIWYESHYVNLIYHHQQSGILESKVKADEGGGVLQLSQIVSEFIKERFSFSKVKLSKGKNLSCKNYCQNSTIRLNTFGFGPTIFPKNIILTT